MYFSSASENFYELESTLSTKEFYEFEWTLIVKSTHTVVMGDLNAKLGWGEKYIDKYGTGERNSKGGRMQTMAEANKLFVGNVWFRKEAGWKWSWIARSVKNKSEIDC